VDDNVTANSTLQSTKYKKSSKDGNWIALWALRIITLLQNKHSKLQSNLNFEDGRWGRVVGQESAGSYREAMFWL